LSRGKEMLQEENNAFACIFKVLEPGDSERGKA
jgi:hypothetical protein